LEQGQGGAAPPKRITTITRICVADCFIWTVLTFANEIEEQIKSLFLNGLPAYPVLMARRFFEAEVSRSLQRVGERSLIFTKISQPENNIICRCSKQPTCTAGQRTITTMSSSSSNLLPSKSDDGEKKKKTNRRKTDKEIDKNDHDDEEEEDEESYRRRVYGTIDCHDKDGSGKLRVSSSTADDDKAMTDNHDHHRYRTSSSSSLSSRQRRGPSSFRRLSRQLSHRSSGIIRRSSSFIQDSMPETPAGWTVLVTALMSAGLAYEIQLQRQLTAPPVVFYQSTSSSPLSSPSPSPSSSTTNSFMDRLYQKMTSRPDSILSRNIHPSLFVGTRGVVSSAAAYLLGGPRTNSKHHLRFREILTMSQDGAQLALDWEVSRSRSSSSRSSDSDNDDDASADDDDRTIQQSILHGPIKHPVVIILHGINNDSSFGYMRSLQRTYVNRGYAAACMNFRGCGGVPMTTPRGYNGAYTGDIRNVVQQIASRMMKVPTTKSQDSGHGCDDGSDHHSTTTTLPIFLVGNSLGANILTKYLGEEGAAGTLPQCVAGAASLGNPLLIHSGLVKFPFSVLMALGIKKIYLENWKSVVTGMKDFHSKHCIRNGMTASTIAAFDNATAPIFIRNDSSYPFGVKIGYEDGESYWFDASSYRYLKHINIPFLNLTARDDFLVSKPSRNKLGFCISNPNVMVVETRCGGHLGWQGKRFQVRVARMI
jgi:predicted alpha/beta-fold hydrolase